MKSTRLIVVLVVGVLAVLGGAMAYKAQVRSSKGKAIRDTAAAMVLQADIARKYPENVDYVKQLFEKSHDAGVRGAGSLLGASFDEQAYYTSLFREMVHQAEVDGKQEVARSLRNFAVGRNYVDVTAK